MINQVKLSRTSKRMGRSLAGLPWILLLLLVLQVTAPDLCAQARARRSISGQRSGPPAGLDREHLEFIRTHFPDRFRRLERLRREDPAAFREKAFELHSEVRRLMKMSKEDPELFEIQLEEIELRSKINQLARKYRKAGKKSKRETLGRELRESLERSFSLRQQLKQGEFRELQQKLKDLEKGLKRRLERKDELIDERFDELTQDEQSDW